MANRSNYVYRGYLAWKTVDVPSLDTKGPWFDYTNWGNTQGAIYANGARNRGSVYFEFNFRSPATDTTYHFGLVKEGHDSSTLPGMSEHSWAYVSDPQGFYHDSVKTDYINENLYIPSSLRGYYYDYSNNFHRNYYVVMVAIDFDLGYLWFGLFNGVTAYWEGDPVNKTNPTYTFTPNTYLTPALGWKFVKSGFLCTAIVQLGSNCSHVRRKPPSGFTYWDEFDYQKEVLADNPMGYWLASPLDITDSWLLNSLGYEHLAGDSSVQQQYAEHYSGSLYSFLSKANVVMAPAQPQHGYYPAYNSSFSKFPVSLNSGVSFTLESSVVVTGDGAVNGSDDVWTEGSGLVTNYIQANQQGSWTLAQSWVGISLRGRRFKFCLREFEVTASSDVEDGFHHIMAVFDSSAQTLTLYIDGEQAGQATSVTPSSAGTSWLAWGSLRPNQTNGHFPGYLRDCVFYPSVLSAERVAAHYANLLVAPMPNPIGSLVDGRTARFPYFAV